MAVTLENIWHLSVYSVKKILAKVQQCKFENVAAHDDGGVSLWFT